MKPTLFIGSSREGKEIAYGAQQNLFSNAEVTVWDQGVFQVSKSNLESLLAMLDRTDFGMFIFSRDDIITIRGDQNRAVRDNVIFELGLFVGRLGRERSFILLPENSNDLHLPTDLIGMTPAIYEVGRSDGSMQAATGPACHSIRTAIQSLGRRRDYQQGPTTEPVRHEPSESDKVAQGEVESSAETTAPPRSRIDWLVAYHVRDYRRAVTLIEDQIKELPEGDEKIDLESWRGRVTYRLDAVVGTEILEKLIDKYPDSHHPYVHLAVVQTDVNEKLRILDRGIAAAKLKDEVVHVKSTTLRRVGREAEAIEVLRQAISLDPNIGSYYHEIARIQKEMGQEDEMRSTLDAGLRICPDDQSLLSFYADELFQGEDKTLALIPYNRLVLLDRESTTYLALRGNLYVELELYDSAMNDYKRANELAGEKQAWILANIGNLYKNRGFFSDGIEYLKKAVALSPDNDYAHQRLGVSLELKQNEKTLLQSLIKEARKELAARQLSRK